MIGSLRWFHILEASGFNRQQAISLTEVIDEALREYRDRELDRKIGAKDDWTEAQDRYIDKANELGEKVLRIFKEIEDFKKEMLQEFTKEKSK